MANYMYGLPGDDKETIKKTYELSVELCTSDGIFIQRWLCLVACTNKELKMVLKCLKVILLLISCIRYYMFAYRKAEIVGNIKIKR